MVSGSFFLMLILPRVCAAESVDAAGVQPISYISTCAQLPHEQAALRTERDDSMVTAAFSTVWQDLFAFFHG